MQKSVWRRKLHESELLQWLLKAAAAAAARGAAAEAAATAAAAPDGVGESGRDRRRSLDFIFVCKRFRFLHFLFVCFFKRVCFVSWFVTLHSGVSRHCFCFRVTCELFTSSCNKFKRDNIWVKSKLKQQCDSQAMNSAVSLETISKLKSNLNM